MDCAFPWEFYVDTDTKTAYKLLTSKRTQHTELEAQADKCESVGETNHP